MKKVFSVKKFEEDMMMGLSTKLSMELAKERIKMSKGLWANKCDGLTAKEMMAQYGCATLDDWMIEVEE